MFFFDRERFARDSHIMGKTKSDQKFRKNLCALEGKVKEKSRNRTDKDKETEVFCSVLADGEHNFAYTLESKALKNKGTRKSLKRNMGI